MLISVERIRNKIICCCIIMLFTFLGNALLAQCDLREYSRIFALAESMQGKGQFIDAKNAFEAAKIYACNERQKVAAEANIDALFEQIEKLRKKSDYDRARADSVAQVNKNQALEAYANDLAFRSQIALEHGDLTEAFRIAEFGYLYLPLENNNIFKALIDAFYYNSNREHTPYAINLRTYNCKSASIPHYLLIAPGYDKIAIVGSNDTIEIVDFQCGNSLFKLKKSNSLSQVSFSPNGDKIVIANGNGVVQTWSLQTGEELSNFTDCADFKLVQPHFTCVKFLPDGERLVTACLNNSLKIWDVKTGKLLQTIIPEDTSAVRKNNFNGIYNISFTRDCNKMAYLTGLSAGNKIYIWQFNGGGAIQLNFAGHFFTNISFSPDTNLLAVSHDQIIDIIDWKGGAIKQSLDSRNNSSIRQLCFSPDGQSITCAYSDNSLGLWNLGTRQLELIFKGHSNAISDIMYSNDGKILLTASRDLTVKTWDLSRKEIYSTPYMSEAYGPSTIFSPDLNFLISQSDLIKGRIVAHPEYNKISVVRLFDKKVINTLRSSFGTMPSTVLFSKDHKYLASRDEAGILTIWEFDVLFGTYKIKTKTNYYGVGLIPWAFSENDKVLIFSNVDKLYIYNVDSNKIIFYINLGNGSNGESWIRHVSISPDNLKVALVISDKAVVLHFFDLFSTTDTMMVTVINLNAKGWSSCFSSDGRRLITSSESSTINIWDPDTGALLQTLEDPNNSPIINVSFFKNGNNISSINQREQLIIWDLISGKQIITFPNAGIGSIVTDKSEKKIAISGSMGSIWDLDRDTILYKFHVNYPLPNTPTLDEKQLVANNLEQLLDSAEDNEMKLISSGEVWQIAAFADMYFNKIYREVAPNEKDYIHALHLYSACLASDANNDIFENKIDELKVLWKRKKKK